MALGQLGRGPGLLAAVDADTAADEFDGLRARWLELLTGGSAVDPADPLFAGRLTGIGRAATSLRETMAPSSTALWSDLPFDASSSVTGSYTRLQRMALAYASPGTELTGDAGLAADVVAGLDHMYARAYNEDISFFGNRNDWQVGGPSALLDCCALVWEQLSADRLGGYLRAVDHFVPDPTTMLTGEPAPRTSRVSLGWIVARRGIAGRNAGKLTAARDALSQVFTPATSGDGFYRDGSFIHHKRVAYTGTYGEEVLDLLSRFFWVLTGSTWAISQTNRQFIYDAVDTTFAPFIYRGLMMDSVRGRAISRRTQTDHLDGHRVIGDALWLARTAPAAQAQRLRALSKGWIGRDSFSSYLDSGQVSVPDVALAKAALDDPTPPADEPVYHRQFHYMDRVVHRRPGWSVAISMASKRIAWFESLNGENLRGWHTGAGTTYTYSPQQLGQYTQDFWATVDPYRLPGITVSRKTLADGSEGTSTPAPADVGWVGGATDGTYGAVGQFLRGYGSTLRAKKSWFCLDDAVICLGAGIACTDGTVVESIVDNRDLGATAGAALAVDGATKPATLGWSETMPGIRWAHLDGYGGYVFPGGATVKGLRQARTGRWRDVSTSGSATPVTKPYLTLWFDHRRDPSSAAYAYVLLPAATRAKTANRAGDDGWLQILANTNNQQGVQVASLGFVAVNFWAAARVGPLTASQPASVMVREHDDGTARVCVSEPRRAFESVDVTWHRPVAEVTAKDPSITVLGTGDTLRLRVAVSGSDGASHRATVRLH